MDVGRTGSSSRPPRRLENSHALPKGTLPKKLQLFFAPRMPIPYMPPMKKKKPALPYTGVASHVSHFEEGDKKKADENTEAERKFRNPEFAAQCRVDVETKAEKRMRLRKLRVERNAAKIKAAMQHWDPTKDEHIQVNSKFKSRLIFAKGDPFKTLFLARMSYKVTETDLKKIFAEYGPIRNIRIVRDAATGKSRGYAFVEFEHTSDMKEAYKHTDGIKIEGRRVLVDVERGRTMEGWRPARLGGGLGASTRKPKKSTTPRDRSLTKESTKSHRDGRDDRERGRSRDYGSNRYETPRPDGRYRSDVRDRSGREGESHNRERDYGSGGRNRERERRYEGRHEKERPSRYDKRYRPDTEDRPGKKIRDLEEGEVDSSEIKETRRRERDMI